MGNKHSKQLKEINILIEKYISTINNNQLYIDTIKNSPKTNQNDIDRYFKKKNLLLSIINKWKKTTPDKQINIMQVFLIDLDKAYTDYTLQYQMLLVNK